MLARRFNGLVALVLTVCACSMSGIDAPATQPAQPVHPCFPVTAGTIWKYLVTSETNDKPDKPFVQTLTAGEPFTVNRQTFSSIDSEIYQIKSDGVYAAGRRENGKTVMFAEAQKILTSKPRSGEAWNATDKADSTYITCLGSQTIKTEAGEFATQCLFLTGGADGDVQRQSYRYYARGVGLVRETIADKSKRADGSMAMHEVTRDLIAFTPAVEISIAEPLVPREPIGADTLRGELSDPSGQPIAQATLTLRRLDKPGARELQTDVVGRFTAVDLDPAGSYVLASHLIGYESTEMPLRSEDRKTVRTALKLKSNAAPDASADAPFAAGKKLAMAGDHKAALVQYKEALTIDPKNSLVLAYKALSHLALGQTPEAQQASEEALKLNDKDALVWEVVGQVKVAQNQSNQARAVFDKAAALSPKTAGAMYLDLAAAFAGKNDTALTGEIESALRAAAAAEPPSGEALFQLGQSYANAGKQQGKAFLRRYLDVAANQPDAEQDKQKIQVAKQLIRALDALNQVK